MLDFKENKADKITVAILKFSQTYKPLLLA